VILGLLVAKDEVNIDIPISAGMPTAKQINKIREIAKDKQIFYDFTDITGNSINQVKEQFSKFLGRFKSHNTKTKKG